MSAPANGPGAVKRGGIVHDLPRFGLHNCHYLKPGDSMRFAVGLCRGFLGMSGMVTGIGVAVLIGVGAYTGVRKLTGANEIDRFKRRELMLEDVLKQNQSTISLLIEDINYIIEKMNEVIKNHGIQSDAFKKLWTLVKQYTEAGVVLTENSNSVQGSVAKIHCAKFLDEDRLKSLTKEPTKAEFFDFIRGFYEEGVFVSPGKDGQKHEATRLAIRKDKTSKDLEKLAKAFEIIGYFKAPEVLKGKLSGLFS